MLSETWTIMSQDGGIAVDFTSFVNIDVTSENPVTQAPIERGGFVDYNRVISPTSLGLMLSVEGNPAHLQTVLAQIDELGGNTQLVNVLTPYNEFQGYAIEKWQYSQDNTSGVNVLYFNFQLTQVRQVETQYSNARVSSCQKRGQQQAPERSIMSSIFG